MKIRFSLLIVMVLVGCAQKSELIGITDFNPIYAWAPTMRVFALPDPDPNSPDASYRIEAKLARLTLFAGNRAGLRFVNDPDSADAFMWVKYRMDTVSYVVPASSYGYSYTSQRYSQLARRFLSDSYGWSIMNPSYEVRERYVTIELWQVENPLTAKVDSGEIPVHMVSYATAALGSQDHNTLTYQLLIACIKSIPGGFKYFEDNIPIIKEYLPSNWLTGVKFTKDGTYINPSLPFEWDDIIYEINGTRIWDYFDYKAEMFSLPEESDSCTIKVNRHGRQMEFEYEF